MQKPSSLQDPYLNAIRTNKVPVAIFLVNGVKLQGTIISFDSFSLLLKGPADSEQLIYKHAISTVQPQKKVDFRQAETKRENKQAE